MAATLIEGWIDVLLALVLISGAFLITRKDLLALTSTYAFQSALLSILAFLLYGLHHNSVLVYLGILTLVSKTIAIPWFIRRIQRKMQIKRDIEFHYLGAISSIFVTLLLILLTYVALSQALVDFAYSLQFYLGSVLGVSLTLMGMVVVFSRRKVITKILGYLMMENGVLLFGMFIAELPFIIEALVIVDLVILVLLAAVMAIGIDTSIERFHARIQSIRGLLSEDDEI